MFRAALLSIVLTLAAGQDAALLCLVWCHSGGGTVGACAHAPETASPGIVANGDCAVTADPVVFVREDGRRDGSTPDVVAAVTAASFAFTRSTAATLSEYEPDSRLLLAFRPFALPLRI